MVGKLAGTALLAASLSGCIAKTVVDIATLPVKVVSKGVDLATTSQSEADQNRGRKIREREEKLGKLQREFDKQAKKCAEGDSGACARRDTLQAEMDELNPANPVRRNR